MVSVIETISTQRKAEMYYRLSRVNRTTALKAEFWSDRVHFEQQASRYQRNAAYLSAVDRRERGVE